MWFSILFFFTSYKSYRGKEHHPDDTKIFIPGKKNSPLRFQKPLKSRPAIEPIIGHLKNDHRLGRNYLLGKLHDKINAILSGCAFNLNKTSARSFTPHSLD